MTLMKMFFRFYEAGGAGMVFPQWWNGRKIEDTPQGSAVFNEVISCLKDFYKDRKDAH